MFGGVCPPLKLRKRYLWNSMTSRKSNIYSSELWGVECLSETPPTLSAALLETSDTTPQPLSEPLPIAGQSIFGTMFKESK